jgi:hypothetical protein
MPGQDILIRLDEITRDGEKYAHSVHLLEGLHDKYSSAIVEPVSLEVCHMHRSFTNRFPNVLSSSYSPSPLLTMISIRSFKPGWKQLKLSLRTRGKWFSMMCRSPKRFLISRYDDRLWSYSSKMWTFLGFVGLSNFWCALQKKMYVCMTSPRF